MAAEPLHHRPAKATGRGRKNSAAAAAAAAAQQTPTSAHLQSPMSAPAAYPPQPPPAYPQPPPQGPPPQQQAESRGLQSPSYPAHPHLSQPPMSLEQQQAMNTHQWVIQQQRQQSLPPMQPLHPRPQTNQGGSGLDSAFFDASFGAHVDMDDDTARNSFFQQYLG